MQLMQTIFIIELTVSNSPNDYNEFIPIFEQVNDNVSNLPEDCEALMDNGFSMMQILNIVKNMLLMPIFKQDKILYL